MKHQVWEGMEVELNFTATASEAGMRIDIVLVARIDGLGRAGAKDLLAERGVRVNGRVVRKAFLLSDGDRVSIDRQPQPSAFAPAANSQLPLSIAYEDEHVVVIDKAAGVPSHPLQMSETATVANALVARDPSTVDIGYAAREGGLLHRLDVGTSGLLMAARTKAAFEFYRDAFRDGRVIKHYAALCIGWVRAPQLIDLPIASDDKDKRKVIAVHSQRQASYANASPAFTRVLDAVHYGRALGSEHIGERADVARCSLVAVSARSARRHQVRAHLAAVGHPLFGDVLYDGPELPGLAHHLLHAERLVFPVFSSSVGQSVDATPSETITVHAAIPTFWHELLTSYTKL